MTGRAYMGEVLIKVWVKSIKKYVSELLHKQVNAQKENLKKTSGVHTNSHKPTKKCAMMKVEELELEKKREAPKIFFDGRKEFIRRVRKTCLVDIKLLQVNDSSYIEGTICLVNE